MILFREDWKKYPTAIIHYETLNKSSLELAAKLKHMGIENNSFFLSLLDPRIKDLDPFSETLTETEKVLIATECKKNPWYVLREIARAPSLSGRNPSRIDFNRSIVCVWWCFFNHVTIILTQPRQTGKSFAVDILVNGLKNFWAENVSINLLTLNEKLRGATVKRVRDIYDEFPEYLIFKTRNDLNNTEKLTIKVFNNEYTTHVAQLSSKAAYNAARGLSTPLLHIDEGPFQPFLTESLDACLPAMDAAIESAKRNNEPYGLIFTTTAGKIDEISGRLMYNMIVKSNKWTELFYDCNSETHLREIFIANKNVYRVYAEFNHRQLGKTDEWLEGKLRERDMSRDAIERDYYNIWTSGTESNPIPAKILERMLSSVIMPKHTDISKIGDYITRWYIPENEVDRYMSTNKVIIGIDPSDASGGDFTSFVGVDIKTAAVVFIGQYNETNLLTFNQWLVDWLVKYPNCTMIIERRSTGSSIIDYLINILPQKDIDPFKRLFNWVVNNNVDNRSKYDEINKPLHRRNNEIYTQCKKQVGFATSAGGETSRTDLYNNTLQTAVKITADRLMDKELYEQLSSLVKKNDRIDHASGKHDDLVIGWLLVFWMLTNAKNLDFYGIDSYDVLSDISKPDDISNPIDAMEAYEQQRVRNRIKILYELLTNEFDSNICDRYESELRYLDSRLILSNDEIFSVDEAIRKAKEESNMRKRNMYQR